MKKITRLFLFPLLAATMALAVTSCGGSEEEFAPHAIYINIGGYYVDRNTPESERQPLRIGLFGLAEGGSWRLVNSAPVMPYPDDQTIPVALLKLEVEPDPAITIKQSYRGVDYYLLETRAWLDLNFDSLYQQGEPFADNKSDTIYDPNSTQDRIYFFTTDSLGEGAVYGYNYFLGTSYHQDFEELDPVTDSTFYLATAQVAQ